jgi:hypothetical protein
LCQLNIYDINVHEADMAEHSKKKENVIDRSLPNNIWISGTKWKIKEISIQILKRNFSGFFPNIFNRDLYRTISYHR